MGGGCTCRTSAPATQQTRQYAERSAINAPMQGTAADIIKRAMIAVDAWCAREDAPARLIMQVHDELVLEVRSDAVEARDARPCESRWPVPRNCACRCESTSAPAPTGMRRTDVRHLGRVSYANSAGDRFLLRLPKIGNSMGTWAR